MYMAIIDISKYHLKENSREEESQLWFEMKLLVQYSKAKLKILIQNKQSTGQRWLNFSIFQLGSLILACQWNWAN